MKVGRDLQSLAAEIERQAKSKKDYVAVTGDLGGVTMVTEKKEDGLTLEPRLTIGDLGSLPITPVAHGQIAEHTGIPKKYYDKMLADAPDLLATNVDRWFQRYPAPRMIRTLDGNARAFLSDKFQRLDYADFAEATLPVLLRRRLNVISCEITETRLYIKAVDEQLFRDVPIGHKMGDGSHCIFDTVAPFVTLSNSETGFARLAIESGVFTRACTNLALFPDAGMRRTHVGARNFLGDGISAKELETVMSDKTRQKMIEALWSQVADVLAATFDEKVVRRRVEALEVAAGRKIEGKVEKVVELAAEKFGLVEDERESVLKHLIEGGSLTQYGLHAAVTRMSADVASYDRATELERLGGRIIELPRTEWQALAEAA